jgi:hypothetical protein
LKDEAEHLLDPFFGFTRARRRDEPAEKFSWSEVLNWSMTKNQETIAVNAPAIFACLTSITVSDRAQKKLARAAEETIVAVPEPTRTEPESRPESEPTPPANSAESDSDDSDIEHEDEDEQLGTGVPPKMRRDPWLVSNIIFKYLLDSNISRE